MKAIVIPRYGKADVLRIEERPDPEISNDDVRIDVKAIGINFAEVVARKGLYPDAPKPPCVVGYEVAGVISETGKNVNQYAIGDRVVALTRFGGNATIVVVPQQQIFRMPDSMRFEEGAAIPVNYLTAYHMLFNIRRIRPGEKVLLHMASGGVGTAVLQLLSTIDNIETFGTASAAKHEHIQNLGCDYPIDYRNHDYAEFITSKLGKNKIDLVLDPLGGGDWQKGYSLLRPGGMLIAFGWANMDAGATRSVTRVVSEFWKQPKFAPMKLMDHNRIIAGVNLGHLWDEIPMLAGAGDELMALYDKGVVRSHVDRVFALNEAVEAHRYFESRQSVGKVVISTEA